MPIHHPSPTHLGLVMLLAGCAGQPTEQTGAGIQHRPYDAPHIDLVKPLDIPPGEASVRLQYGHPVPRNGVQDTDPHCILELETVRDTVQTVRPDRFQVVGVQRREESFGGMPVVNWHVLGRGIGRDRGPSQIYYLTEFRLRSNTQTGVRSLTCQHNQAAAGTVIPHHLSPTEMRQALGEYFVLDLGR